MTGFAIGLLVGTFLGIALMAMLVIWADDEMDRDLRRLAHTCGPKCEPLAGIHRSEWS